MAPLLRRSWAPRGQAPILSHRTRHHQKVSAIAALCVPPSRRTVQLYFRLHPDKNITGPEVVLFLRHLLRQLRHPIVLIWDRLLAHRGNPVKNLLRTKPPLHAEFLPPYAPELNPVENLWSYLKMNPLANLAILELSALRQQTHYHASHVQRQQHLLRAFIKHSALPLRLK